MRFFKELRTAFVLIAVFCLAVSGVSVAQQQTGDLYGKVMDEKGTPLPGVTLTLSGASGDQAGQSDENGAFRFNGLYPGQYSLKAELSGFSAVEQKGIGVRLGGKAQVELTLSSDLKETIVVTAEKPLLNPRELDHGVTLGAKDLEQVPTARDPWSLLSQAPGVQVDRVNVGGNESGQQSNFLVGGATASDNTFSVDGMILTDMAAVGGSATYFDFGAYEEVQVTTASTDVSIQTAGVTINQITKRGTNEWRGDARYLKTQGSWQSNPKEVNGNKIDDIKEYGGNIGGPLMADHLWLWGSYGENDIGNIVGVSGQLDATKIKDDNAKLNFQFGANSGTVHYWKNNKLKNGRGAGFDRTPETTWDQTTPSEKWKFEDTQLFGSTFMLNGLYSHDPGAFTLHPRAATTRTSFWTTMASGAVASLSSTRPRPSIRPSSTELRSPHGRLGPRAQVGGSYRTQENDSISTLPNGRLVETRHGLGLCDDPGDPLSVVEWIRHNVSLKSKYQAAWAKTRSPRIAGRSPEVCGGQADGQEQSGA